METASGKTRQYVRFGSFELDRHAGELRKSGIRIRLQQQPLNILTLLVDRAGEMVTREEMCKQLWPEGLHVDFDRSLNKAIVKLRDALGDSAKSPRFIETLPRRGYRFLLRPESSVEQTALPKCSIAVLPMANHTGDPTQEYFVDGMTDTLITHLAQIQSVHAISRTSVMRYKDSKKPLGEIARELKVDVVVEGAVMRAGERVRINVQMIDASTDGHLWADVYDRDLCDVLALQSDVARAIVRELRLQLSTRELTRLASSRIVHPKGYELYLKGRFYWNKRTEAALKRSLELFREAIDEDSSFAPSHAGLADSYCMLAFWGAMPPQEAYPAAKLAAAKALEADDSLAEAHAARAWTRFAYDWDWSTAEAELQRAVHLNPGYTTARQWQSHLYAYRVKNVEAMQQVRRTLELDPVSVVMNSSAAFVCSMLRLPEQAVVYSGKALDLDPAHAPALCWLGLARQQQGVHEEALEAFDEAARLSERSPVILSALGCGHAMAGRAKTARDVLEELASAGTRRYVPRYYLALVHAGLGEADTSIKWLQAAFREKDAWLMMLKADFRFDLLRKRKEFRQLLHAVGLG
jgi:TolB-like protein/Tfp pilus assembly protein PilF